MTQIRNSSSRKINSPLHPPEKVSYLKNVFLFYVSTKLLKLTEGWYDGHSQFKNSLTTVKVKTLYKSSIISLKEEVLNKPKLHTATHYTR